MISVLREYSVYWGVKRYPLILLTLKIPEVMLKKAIGLNAKKILRMLDNNGRWSYDSLKKVTGLSDCELSLALGWLSAKGKIESEDCRNELFFFKSVNVYIG